MTGGTDLTCHCAGLLLPELSSCGLQQYSLSPDRIQKLSFLTCLVVTIVLFCPLGIRNDPEEKGVIPNSFSHVFTHIARTQNKKFLVRASYLEIYQVLMHSSLCYLVMHSFTIPPLNRTLCNLELSLNWVCFQVLLSILAVHIEPL